MQLLKLVINLDRCDDRLEVFNKYFYPNKIQRFKAFNGLEYSDGTYDKLDKPNWDEKIRQQFISDGILYDDKDKYGICPTEFACTLSHIKCWERFLKTKKYTHLCVFEDDTKPTELLEGKKLEDTIEIGDNDILYLFGPDHPGQRIRLDKNGEVKNIRSHMGYIMTRKGAELAIEAMKPILFQSDWQVSRRIARNMEKRFHKFFPVAFKRIPTIKVSGLFEPLIEHNEFAKTTTFTQTGKKTWLGTKQSIM